MRSSGARGCWEAFTLAALLAAGTGCVGDINPGGAQARNGSGGKAPSVEGTGGITGAGSGGDVGTGGTDPSGSGGQSVSGSGGNLAAGSGGTTCSTSGLPSSVTTLLSFCSSCHGSTPLAGAPSLVTYAELTSPSTAYPTQTGAQRALARLQSTTSPMPPSGTPRPSDADVAALQAWIDAGYPAATTACAPGTGGAGGGGSSGTGGSDPFAGPSVCTSKTMWTGGNRESPSMNPGKACIACHAMGEGPSFALAGTVYPTAHEPDLCNGASGSTTGARVVITDATGKVITLTPNDVGNFSYEGALAKPFQASVTYMGRERRMLTPQTNGDCNACHTTSGAMSAPGRVLLP